MRMAPITSRASRAVIAAAPRRYNLGERSTVMSDQQRPPQGQQSSAEAASARMRRRADLIEELLEDARARGEFDNLKGAGQPLDLQRDVYAGDKALAYSLLKNNQMAPPEIER